jgi:hypothetical protein
MTDDEVQALVSAGAERLVLNAALHPRIPLSLAEAHSAPLTLLLQAEALMASWKRIDKRQALLTAHRKYIEGRSRGKSR